MAETTDGQRALVAYLESALQTLEHRLSAQSAALSNRIDRRLDEIETKFAAGMSELTGRIEADPPPQRAAQRRAKMLSPCLGSPGYGRASSARGLSWTADREKTHHPLLCRSPSLKQSSVDPWRHQEPAAGVEEKQGAVDHIELIDGGEVREACAAPTVVAAQPASSCESFQSGSIPDRPGASMDQDLLDVVPDQARMSLSIHTVDSPLSQQVRRRATWSGEGRGRDGGTSHALLSLRNRAHG